MRIPLEMTTFPNTEVKHRRRDLLTLGGAFFLSQPIIAAQDKPKIRIGQIGAKHAHAMGKLSAILKYPEVFEFVGIAEPDSSRREQIQKDPKRKKLSWLSEEELLAQPDLQAVAVETEVEQLVPTAMRCLAAGKHVHLDKPAGTSLQACRAMHDLAVKNDLTIQMGYMLRYNPAFQFAHRIVREGWLGEITEISGMIGKYMNDSGRESLSRFEGGGMFELACHLIDQVVYLLGEPKEVTAFVRRSFPEKDNFADNQLAVFEYEKALAIIRCNHIDPMGGPRRQFSITGTQGTFEIRPLEPAPVGRLGLDRPHGEYKKGYQEIKFEKPPGRYDEEFLDLAKVIRAEKTLAWDAKHDLAAHEAVLRASRMIGG